MVGSSSRVWQRSSPALGLQPPTPSVAQLWVALAPQFDYKTCYLSGGFVVQVWCFFYDKNVIFMPDKDSFYINVLVAIL